MDISKDKIEELEEMSQRIRLKALEMALESGNYGSHLGGSLSCVEIMSVLYGFILGIDVNNPLSPDRDIFIASKAHCILSQIPALAESGYIDNDEIMGFLKDGDRLNGHTLCPEIGMEYSGGSLGMAISVGVGLALSAKERRSRRNVYILLGDGELDEGSIWEAFMSASHYKLNNLTVIIDRNHLSYDGNTEEVMGLEDLSEKMKSFGWNVSSCDGHSICELLESFADADENKPHCIIANTIKGKGVSFAENKAEWHHHRLSKDEYDKARQEVLRGQ